MKRFFYFLGVILLSMNAIAADRQHTLKVYNWADYINEDVLNAFPAWYKAQTGEEVEIIYQTFDINESMLAQIEKGKEDYDVICPSEYIIERMLRQNLLRPLLKELIPDSIRYFDNVAPFVVDKFQQMSSNGLRVSDYAVGYMWGTTGFLYNTALVDAADLQSWNALLDPRFEGRIFMKDAFRDVYSVLVLYAYYDDILAGNVTRDELVQNITPERIEAVENLLYEARYNIAGWEVDFGKEEMTKGRAWINVSWSGDAQWAMDEAAEVGVSLDYLVPQEGSNVWFDGWCIPIYAKNPKAATYFIDYMCRADNALANMDEIGYVSVIATPEIMEAMTDSTFDSLDVSYFFGDSITSLPVNPVFYPDRAVIERCALMKDAAEQTEAMLAMWNRVKGDNLSVGLVIFLVVMIALMITVAIVQAVKKPKTQKRLKKHKKRR